MAEKAESRTRQDDADEWFFTSFDRYKSLNMFELEAPIDTMEFIDATSLCLTGLQAYSKKCEILEMAVPPKLLPKYIEDSLCKDRDFKVLCGGYASSRILQTAPFGAKSRLVAAVMDGQPGLGLFKLGDENQGVIREDPMRLTPFPEQEATKGKQKLSRVAVGNHHLASADPDGVAVWSLDAIGNGNSSPLQVSKAAAASKFVEKMQFIDDHSFGCLTDAGELSVVDTRSALDKVQMSFRMSDACTGVMNRSIGYSFDVINYWGQVCLANTLGAFEVYDLRKSGQSSSETVCHARFQLQQKALNSEFYAIECQALSGKFNIQIQDRCVLEAKNQNIASDQGISSCSSTESSDSIRFLVSGFKEEVVPVYELTKSGDISTVFVHDGHVKTVTQAIWHPLVKNLVFSTSTDAVLEAWQFNENLERPE